MVELDFVRWFPDGFVLFQEDQNWTQDSRDGEEWFQMERKVHFAVSAGDTSAYRGWNAVGHLCYSGMLLARVHLTAHLGCLCAELLRREWASVCIVAQG